MKAFKMLGLAALVALMAMAIVGVSPAAAESTALCATDPGTEEHEVCPVGSIVTHVHETTIDKKLAKLLSSLVNVSCFVLFLGDVTTAKGLGNPLEILGKFTYENCETEGGSGCTVNEVSKHALISVLKLGHELADVTGSAEVLVECGSFIHCVYNGTGLTGHGLGPLLTLEKVNGEVRIEKQTVNKVSGFLCPKTSTLDLLITPSKATSITE